MSKETDDAVLSDADSCYLLVSRAIATSDRGDHPRAISILSEARRRSPHAYEVLANLGNVYLAASEWEHAIELLTEAVLHHPRGAHAHCMLGVALHQAGRPLEALPHLREAVRLEPGWETAHYNLQRALEMSRPPMEPSSGAITGDLETFRLPELLEFLRMQRSTGTVTVTGERGTGTLRLFEGELIGAAAPGTPELAELLRDAIDPRALDAVIEEQQRFRDESELLSDTLLKKRLVSAELLKDAVMEQLICALSEVMSWTIGQFSFHARRIADRPSLRFDTQGLMLEAARRGDEDARDTTGS